VRSVFIGGCVQWSHALEAVAQPSQVIKNLVVSGFVFPPLPTFSSDMTFSVVVLFVPTSEVLSSVSLEASLKSEGPSLALVSTFVGPMSIEFSPPPIRRICFFSMALT